MTNDHRPMTKVVLPRKRTEFMSVQSQNSRMLQKILKYSPFKLPIYHYVMQTTSATKTYDLKIRTAQFAKDVRALVRSIPINITNYDDIKQVLRSSGSIGA